MISTEQLLFADLLEAARPTDRLFFALFPDARTADAIDRLAHRLRAQHGLIGRPLMSSRFHVSLHCLGDHAGLRQNIVEQARIAAARIATPPFSVTFDRALSFERRSADTHPFVLGSSGDVAALKTFRRDLGAALKHAGLRGGASSFTPHVTLLYDRQRVAAQWVESVSWTVSEFALVHSLLGRTQYLELGRWRLDGGGGRAP